MSHVTTQSSRPDSWATYVYQPHFHGLFYNQPLYHLYLATPDNIEKGFFPKRLVADVAGT